MRSRYSTLKNSTDTVSNTAKTVPYWAWIAGTDSRMTATTLLSTIKVSTHENNQAAFLSLWPLSSKIRNNRCLSGWCAVMGLY